MNDFNSKRKVAFYIRVSTERQAKVKEGSLKNQKQILLSELEKRNLQDNNWGELIEIYVDEGISGKDTNRPAFQRMIKNIEISKIDTVMFTELSRLSRSLKDFINIFEFIQKYNCDLICLKTDIDTTSPYKNLITKILMVFGEFEREMTSQRTSINAYERSKRGLANGGFVSLGYKRNKIKKGYLYIDKKEAEIVREIFRTYLKEKSITGTLEIIQSKYEGFNFKLKKITKSRIHSILTNKAYIGIREIYKRDRGRKEEVPAVWEGIVDNRIFNQAEKLLQANRERFHSRKTARFNYFLSGLFLCGKCGQRLQGKSAYSRISKKHYYYSHKHICKNNGINRIGAEATHKLILDWLRDISTNGDKFRQLQEQGKIRISKRISFLNRSLKELDSDKMNLDKEVDIRVSELVRAKSDIVKDTIEKSIIKLEEDKKEIEAKRLYIPHEIEELNKLLANEKNLFKEYSQKIKDILKSGLGNIREQLREMISFVRLEETEIKIALSGVNQKGLVSALFVTAPRDGHKTNEIDIKNHVFYNIILDKITLPSGLLLRSRSYLSNLYIKRNLSKREIAKRLNISHSTVIEALRKAGIHKNKPNNIQKRKGQIPYGYDYKKGELIKNNKEQEIIGIIKQLKLNGLSLRGIARELNEKLIHTKNNSTWQANTIRKILQRNRT